MQSNASGNLSVDDPLNVTEKLFSGFMVTERTSKELLDFLYRPVERGGLGKSITEISRLIGKDSRTVSTWFRRMGISIRSNTPVRIGVLTDKQLFPFLDKIGENEVLKIPFHATEELLWILGFALADGSVALSARTLEIGNSEFELLPIIKNILASTVPHQ